MNLRESMTPQPLRQAGAPLVLVLDLRSGEDGARSSCAATLRADGSCGVIEARSVDHAVTLVSAQRPDIVVITGDAEDAAALTMCARIRAARGAGGRPVLALTTSDEASWIARLCEAGATDVALRPISGALLALRIRGLVTAWRASVGGAQAEAHLGRARRVARVAQFCSDPDARTFRWCSDPAVLGGAPGVLGGEGALSDELLNRVHANDRPRVEAALAARTAHQIDYRLIALGGEERFVHQDVEPSVDPMTGRTCLFGTVQDVTELREAEADVAHLAYYDELTSLPNRAHAARFLQAAIAGAKRRHCQVAILAIDLDLFRRINDNFGHSAGNSVLEEVAIRLRAVVAEEAASNGRPEALVARLGGDEFAVILRDVVEDDETSTLFHKIARRLTTPYQLQGTQVVLASSAGEARYPRDGSDADTLFKHAASAMHSAKELGGAGFKVFAAEMQKKLERKLDIERRLRAALATGTCLELHYQPKVDAASRHVAGVEALLRFTAKDGGAAISPFELVAVAEETGLIHPLGDWILRTACVQANAWSRSGQRPIPVAVNISAHQFATADFVEKIAQALVETGLAPALLELEITEGVMMGGGESATRVLERLKQLGLRVALDDFGTGYSSLAYLTRFPIDCLKIDRSFVVGIGVEEKSEMIISAIIALARSLRIEVVAEGVETEDQLRFLERQGALEIQGWLFSKALPPELVTAWIEQHERRSRRSGVAPPPPPAVASNVA